MKTPLLTMIIENKERDTLKNTLRKVYFYFHLLILQQSCLYTRKPKIHHFSDLLVQASGRLGASKTFILQLKALDIRL